MSQVRLDLSHHFRGVQSRSKSIKRVVEKSTIKARHANDLAGDLFSTLFQQNPQLLKGDPENKYQQALRAVLSNKHFDSIRSQTRGSLQWASVGATILMDELIASTDFSNDEYPKEQEQPKNEPQPKRDKPESEPDKTEPDGDSDGEDDNDSESGDSGDSESDDLLDEFEDDSESEDSDNEDESDDSDDGDSDSGDPTNDPGNSGSDNYQESDQWEDAEDIKSGNSDIDDAVERAAERLDDLLGGLKAGQGNKLPTFEDSVNQTELVAQLLNNPNTARILKLVGRLRLNSNFLPAMTTGYPQETVGITHGRELSRVLPQDMGLLLGNQEEFAVFVDKFNNGALLQYESKSSNNVGKGPMIICLDNSVSMDGEKLEWASALTAACYLQCIKERRAFAVVPFSDSAQLFEPAKQYVLDPVFLNRIVGTRVNGGTNFNSAWRYATDFMKKSAKTSVWKNADMVFVTDGEGPSDKDVWTADKKKYNLRLVSFMIQMSEELAMGVWEYPEGHPRYYLNGMPKKRHVKELADLSDVIVFIPRLTDAANKDAFNIINKKSKKAISVR